MTVAPVDVAALFVDILGPGTSTSVPNPRPERFKVVTASGGDQVNYVQGRPRVIVECWAPTSVQAFEDAAAAWSAVQAVAHTMVGDVWVSSINLTLPADFPDPDTRTPRYQFVAQPYVALHVTPEETP